MSIVPPTESPTGDPGRRRAIIIVASLVAVMALIVGAAIVFSDSPRTPSSPIAEGEFGSDAGGDEEPNGSGQADDPEDATEPPGEDTALLAEEPEEEEPAEEASSADGTQLVDLDGVCEVELAADELRPDPRPWNLDPCTAAPIDLDDGAVWIIVLASLSGDEQDEAGARETAEDRGFGDRLLWSDHYPSLNPGWWVAFDGPFTTEDEAVQAADERGGGAYPRRLEDDTSPRYCLDECLEAAEDAANGG